MPIGSWVLTRVCAQLARWPETIRVSANVSALQIKPELVTEVQHLLASASRPNGWCSRSPRASCSTRTSNPSSPACATRRPARAGRLRHRLLVAGEPPAIPAGPRQARPHADRLPLRGQRRRGRPRRGRARAGAGRDRDRRRDRRPVHSSTRCASSAARSDRASCSPGRCRSTKHSAR